MLWQRRVKGTKTMISVIVTVYNEEKYLKQCMESICGQTYGNLEIIIVNDGSTDQSAKICDAFAGKDSRITVIHKENGGPVSARKAGLSSAHGRYITFIDGDDWIEDTMYEKLLKCLEEYHTDVAMCGRYEDTGNISKAIKIGRAHV